jgi:uncharacterized protein (DUF58 family)
MRPTRPVPLYGGDPAELLRRVRRVELRTRRLVRSLFAGEYLSVFQGRGLEFAEVRAYAPGDDVRAIDWNVTARLGTPYVKQFVEERELTVFLLVDVSGSQRWGTRRQLKSELTAEAAVTLGMSATQNNDRVGLMAVTDRVEHLLPPRKGRRHALRVVRDLLALCPEGRGTDLAAALRQATRSLPPRSIVFLISDFRVGEGMAEFARALAAAAVRHDVVVVRTVDPGEEAPGGVGMLALEDPESGARRLVQTGGRGWREARRAREEEEGTLRALFRRLGVDLVELRTDEPIARPVLAFFRQRERRRRRR